MIEFKRKGGFDEKRNILCKLACFNNDILVYPRLNTLIFTTCMVSCWLPYYKNNCLSKGSQMLLKGKTIVKTRCRILKFETVKEEFMVNQTLNNFHRFFFLNDLDKKDKNNWTKVQYNVYTFVSQIFPMGWVLRV